MTKRVSRADRLSQQIREQEMWIKQCGGSLAGYVQNYGSKDDPEHSGNGGEAIYAADLAALTKFQADYAYMRTR